MIALALLAAAAVASEPCRTVHGRMELWNGTPTVRISVSGTRQILGIIQPNESFDDLPASVRHVWTGRDPEADWKTSIHGDFKVCPKGLYRPGRMQRVRLVDAVRLTASPRPQFVRFRAAR